MPTFVRTLVLGSVLLSLSGGVAPAEAQLDRLKRKAKEKIEQKLEDKQDGAKDGAKATEGGGAAADGAQASADAAAMKPGQGAWANYDFVPGERVLFAEDFTRDRVGNFPQRLEFLNGSMEVVTWQGQRLLRISSTGAFAIQLPEVLPERFTIEFESTIPWVGLYVHSGSPEIADNHIAVGSIGSDYVMMRGPQVGLFRADMSTAAARDTREVLAKSLGDADPAETLVTTRIHADGRYVKVYLNEVRIANVPNAAFGRSDKVWFQIGADEEQPALIRSISINAGGMQLYDALAAEGRVATQGILFDVNSDRIRPESTPTLTEIGDMLEQYGDLRLTIEGHTDNTGSADANQTLSEKRAAAVKAYLVGTLGIDEARLQAAGFGASRPVAPNDTPEGRQQNRRVELVKM